MASQRSRRWKVATSALALLRAHCASLYTWTYVSTFWSWILELGGSRDCLFMSYLAGPDAAVAIRHSLTAAYSYSWQKLSSWEVVLLARKQEYFTASLTECEYIHSGGSFSIWPCAWTSLLLGTCTAHSQADQSLCWKDYILPNQYFQFGPHASDSRKTFGNTTGCVCCKQHYLKKSWWISRGFLKTRGCRNAVPSSEVGWAEVKQLNNICSTWLKSPNCI